MSAGLEGQAEPAGHLPPKAPLGVFEGELTKAALLDRPSHPLGEAVEVAEVVEGEEHRPEHLPGADQVGEVGAGVGAAGEAVAGLV